MADSLRKEMGLLLTLQVHHVLKLEPKKQHQPCMDLDWRICEIGKIWGLGSGKICVTEEEEQRRISFLVGFTHPWVVERHGSLHGFISLGKRVWLKRK
jgi:hypothetical protein